MPEFGIRDVAREDKEEILALTANTWEDGDYIHWVFDDWVSDTTGRFLAVEDKATGRTAGIDKMSFLSPAEAWFEGLRVHPDYRGLGLSTRFEKYMIEESRRLGASVIRLLTTVANLPVHRNTFRHGFSQRFIVRHWRLTSGEAKEKVTAAQPAYALRMATPDEAPVFHDWWRRTHAGYATGGLLNRQWSFSATSGEEWAERAARGHLLVPEEVEVSGLGLPPPMALISTDSDGPGLDWTISTM